jgi:hypothetical protein
MKWHAKFLNTQQWESCWFLQFRKICTGMSKMFIHWQVVEKMVKMLLLERQSRANYFFCPEKQACCTKNVNTPFLMLRRFSFENKWALKQCITQNKYFGFPFEIQCASPLNIKCYIALTYSCVCMFSVLTSL